ncbi:MAG: hypothetical protein ACOCTR_04830 [Candidatus Natronoplasma sp.]
MNLEKLEKKKEKNKRQRRNFVKFWAKYMREHPDEKWSEQQNLIVNSQIKSHREKSESDEYTPLEGKTIYNRI